MRNSNNSTSRALSILDVLDQYEWINADLLLKQGAARSSVYRDINALVDAGLLARGAKGKYVAGPRYVPQPPGTSFDKETRLRRVAQEAARIKAEAPKRVSIKDIGKTLGYSAAVLSKIMKQYS